MSAVVSPEPQETTESPKGDLEGLDEVHGHICDDCRHAWVGGMDERELGLDPEISSTFSDSARGFAESARHISCADEEDAGHGYFDCLICDVTSIGGFKAIAYMKP
ncbi:hypothetical protein WMO79_00775 [Micrococcaceae bacterium Sec7.4]